MVTEPVTQEADIGVLFMHNEGYSTMCSHGIIALVTALLETGAFPAKGRHTPVNLDTPAGLVRATAHLDNNGHVEQVSFLNVPPFLYARDVELKLPELGRTKVGSYKAIIPEVGGSALITGRHEFVIDPRDDLGRGFLVI